MIVYAFIYLKKKEKKCSAIHWKNNSIYLPIIVLNFHMSQVEIVERSPMDSTPSLYFIYKSFLYTEIF